MAQYPNSGQGPSSNPQHGYPPNPPPPEQSPNYYTYQQPNYNTYQQPAYQQNQGNPMAYQDFRDEQPDSYPGVGMANVPNRYHHSHGRVQLNKNTAMIIGGIGVFLIVLAIILILAV